MSTGFLTREMERRIQTWIFVNSADTTLPVVQPIMVRLMGTNGTADTSGTEIVGDSYAPVESFWGQSTTTPGVEFVNGTTIEFNSLDQDANVTVNGVELWDSSTTPVRVAYAPLAASRTVPAGEPFTITPGQFKVKIA